MSLAQYTGWRNYLAIQDLGWTPNVFGDTSLSMGRYAKIVNGSNSDFIRNTLDEVKQFASAPLVETGGVDTVVITPIFCAVASPGIGTTHSAAVTAWRVTPQSGMGVTNGPFICEKIAKFRFTASYVGSWSSGTMPDDTFGTIYQKPSVAAGPIVNTSQSAAGTALVNSIDWKLTYTTGIAGLTTTFASYCSNGATGINSVAAITGLTGASHVFFGIDMDAEATPTVAFERATLLYRLIGEY